MSRLFRLRPFAIAAFLTVASAFAPSSVAAEDGPACYRYVWVTRYVERQVPYTKLVTQYDACGRAYQVKKTYYISVCEPVRVRVPVCN